MKSTYLVFVLVAAWPDGSVTRTPATNLRDCLVAAEAYVVGPSRSGLLTAATSTRCEPSDPTAAGFEPGWDCIDKYNCGKKR